MPIPLSTLLLLAATAGLVPRFEGLERLYFERAGEPGQGSVRAEAVRALLPGTMPAAWPRSVPAQDMLAATDVPLPVPGLVLRQVHDRGQRITEQWWCLYEKARRVECWYFAPDPRRTDNKLLAEYTVHEVAKGERDRLVFRACGHTSRPQGAWWSHGKDLVFAVEGKVLRLDYVVGRFSLSRGYDTGEGEPALSASTERRLPGAERIERRGVPGVPAAGLASCGWRAGLEDEANCDELERVAQCITALPVAEVRSRALLVPSFAERGGRP
jgi:hypothetical protein